MNLSDNIIVTKTGDKFDIAIINLKKEISETEKEIRNLEIDCEEISFSLKEAKKTFRNKYGYAAIKQGFAKNSEEFQAIEALGHQEEALNETIAWEEAYLEGLQRNIMFYINSVENSNCSEDEIERSLKVFKRKFISWVVSPDYGLGDSIAFCIEQLNFILDIQYDWEKDTDVSNAEGLFYYIATFENKERNKILTINVTLSSGTKGEFDQPN